MTIQTLAKDKSKKHLIGLQRGPDIVAIYREIERLGTETSKKMGKTLAELDERLAGKVQNAKTA